MSTFCEEDWLVCSCFGLNTIWALSTTGINFTLLELFAHQSLNLLVKTESMSCPQFYPQIEGKITLSYQITELSQQG